MFFFVPHWLDSRIEMLQSGLLFVRRLSRCFKVGFFFYAESRGAPKSIFCYTPRFDLERKCKNTISFYTPISKMLQSGFIFIRTTSRCTKVAKKKYGHTKKEKLTVENEFLCMLEFDMPKSCKNKVRTP